MQTILFIKALDNEEAAQKIKAALDETRISYQINTEEHCVIIDGRNDLVYAAKTTLREAGFNVE